MPAFDRYHPAMSSRRSLPERLGDHARAFFTNWQEYDASIGTKLALTLRNRVKALNRTGCCGHHGQPGC
jgi:hypothetical protein